MSKDTSGQSSAQGAQGAQGKQQSSEMSQGRTSAQQGGQTYQPPQGSRWPQSPGDAAGRRAAVRYGPYGGGPFSTMRRISDEMDRLFDSFGFGRGFFPAELRQDRGDVQSSSMLWTPHIDVVERDGKLLISADLPGVKKDDVKVEINQDSVTIQGQRHQEKSSSDRGYYQSERSYGSFYRTIPLPEGANTESASATFRDGVLQIEIAAPSQPARGRTLEIKDADPGAARASGSGTQGNQQQR